MHQVEYAARWMWHIFRVQMFIRTWMYLTYFPKKGETIHLNLGYQKVFRLLDSIEYGGYVTELIGEKQMVRLNGNTTVLGTNQQGVILAVQSNSATETNTTEILISRYRLIELLCKQKLNDVI